MAKYTFPRVKTAVRRMLKDNAIVNLRMRQLYLSAYELLLLCIPYKQAIRATSRCLWRITAMPAEIVMLAGSAMTEREAAGRRLGGLTPCPAERGPNPRGGGDRPDDRR